MKENRGIRIGTVLFLVVATALVSMAGTYFYVSSLVNDIGDSQQMYLELSNVEQIVVQNYVGKINATTGYDAMQEGIVVGYIDGLGDGKSYYLSEKNYKSSANHSTKAIESGIHADYDATANGIAVKAVDMDSPAYNAGVRTGDVILSIDSISVEELGYKAAVRKLSADPDETLTVTVLRSGLSDLQLFELYYKDYAPHTLDYEVMENGYGYIRIYEFAAETVQAFKNACADLTETQGVKGIVIDVRGNADGDYDSMIAVADYLMPAATICHRKQAKAADSTMYTSDAACLKTEIVVLQDATTTGAAELFCAALSESEAAETFGETTAGDARVQGEFALSDGSAIVLSVYEYTTASGTTVEGVGVAPNFEVTQTDGDTDVQLQSAVSYLSGDGEDE